MGHKTLAIINGDNGRRYRVRKWADRHATLCAQYGRPGRIEVQDPDDHGWNHLSWWDAGAEFGNQDDHEVMEEAIHRLDVAFGVEPEEIIYDQHDRHSRPDPPNTTITAL